jgi:DMSO reductase family type II enzyme molybdopterin subunit
MQITRRELLKYFRTGTACLAVSEFVAFKVASGQSTGESLAQEYDYRSWEDLFREKWTWDKVVNSTHAVGCSAQCEWSVFVKDGIAFREEQLEHPRSVPTSSALPQRSIDEDTPDPGPQGCQRGACFTHHMYGPDRIKYPLKRVGKRGEGKWKRISWDEALTEAADAIIDAVAQDGPQSIVSERGDETEYAWRNFFKLLGNIQPDAPVLLGDHSMGHYATFGVFGRLPNRTTLFKSDLIFIWHFNPLYTRIPYYKEYNQARYRGAEIIAIAPDFSPSAVHADYWIPVEPGTDVALALGMCQVLVEEKLYAADFLKEQTDLPFLTRADTGKFLRESDLPSGGRDDRFYLYDLKTNQIVKARTETLDLGEVDPALEGNYEVALSDGTTVRVRPVFERLKEVLSRYEPAAAAQLISGPSTPVHPDVFREVARKAAKAKALHMAIGTNVAKCYHLDLHTRSIALFLVLSGQARPGGQPGGGAESRFWSTTEIRSTLWEIVGAMESPGVEGGVEAFKRRNAAVEEVLEKDSTLTAPIAWRELDRAGMKKHFIVPGWQWLYYRAGFKQRWNNQQWHDPGYRDFQSYADEAKRKGWYGGFIGPDKEKIPVRDRVFISAGGNYLRRMPGSTVLFDDYTPGLEKIIKVDFRMSTSALYADIVLPCTGYYEKIHVRRARLWLMDQAVPPLGEAKSDYSIACLLAKYISKRAKERGITRVEDTRQGITLELDRLYDRYTINEAYKENDEAKLANDMYKIGAAIGFLPKGTTLEEVRKRKGFPGNPSRLPIGPGETVGKAQDKVPHGTLTRRIQFYLDHDWYLEAGEALPVHKPHPPLGGEYPFHQTGGHGRESVHSIWISNPLLLRLTRGVPSLFMNKEAAERMGIEDFEEVEVHNDAGLYRVRVKHSTRMRPNQVAIYHCWEPYQFSKGHWSSVDPCTSKPLMLVGDYGHLSFTPRRWQPTLARRGARVNIRKIT